MRALVTGATGFVGSHLCRALLAAGHEVRAFHRQTSRLTALQDAPVERVIGDVLEPETLPQAMEGVDWVFHTAGRVAHWRDGDLLVDSILKGTRNVLRSAQAAGVKRLVFTSSVAALGVPLNGELLDERHTFNYPPQRWPYGFAKHLAEAEVRAAAEEGLDCVIVNPSSIFGPADLNLIGGSLVIEMAARRVPANLHGGMNSVHVADVVDGHLAAAERGRRGERYILGGTNMTHMDTVAITAEELGMRPPRLTFPAALIEPLAAVVDALNPLLKLTVNGDLLRLSRFFMYYDISKARAELGLEPKRTFRQAIREAIEWYRANGFIR